MELEDLRVGLKIESKDFKVIPLVLKEFVTCGSFSLFFYPKHFISVTYIYQIFQLPGKLKSASLLPKSDGV